MQQKMLPKLIAVTLAVCLMLPMLILPGAAFATPPTQAEIEASLAVTTETTEETLESWVNVALEMAGEPVFKTYLAKKAEGASKTDAATAQKARKADLEKAQAQAASAVKAKAPSATVLHQYQMLLNGLAVRVKRGEVEALRSVPGVVRISEMRNGELDLSNAVPYIGAQRAMTELGVTGRGMTIAVIDSGLDYTHRNMGGPGTLEAYNAAVTDLTAITETVTLAMPDGSTITTKMFPTEKVVGGWDFVGDNWPNTPNNIQEPDPDPMDPTHAGFAGGHGSHVAGIATGMGVPNASVNGSIPADNTFAGTTIFHGVAPAAKIYAYKVCSSVANACDTPGTVAAYERAADPNQDGDMSDHVDAINMSIGGTWVSLGSEIAIRNAVLAGIAVAQSQGNSSDQPYITGERSTLGLAVANIAGPGNFIDALTANAPAAIAGRKFLMVQQSWATPLQTSGPISGELVYVGQGCPAAGATPEDPYLADPNGKIALIIRGVCNVSAKAQRAQQAGALAVVVHNNAAGEQPPSFGSGGLTVSIPTVTITQGAGLALRAQTGVQVSLSTANALSIAGSVAASSSRGPGMISGWIKPDVSAPGTNIISTGAGQGGAGASNTGTSMSAPMAAGLLALVKQAHPTWTPMELRAAVMNTANPVIYDITGLDEQSNLRTTPVSISRQGAGLIDAYRAVKQTTLATSPNGTGGFSFGFKSVVDTHTDSQVLTLHNKGTTARTYNLSTVPHGTLPAGTTISVSPASVTVAAGGTATTNVILSIAAAGLPAYTLTNNAVTVVGNLNRSEIGGYVKVMEDGGAGDTLSLPVYAIARKASAISPSATTVSLTAFGAEDSVALRVANTAANAGTAEVFSYLGADPNETDLADFFDVQYVGVRPATMTVGGQPTPALQFGVKLHGPYSMLMMSRLTVHVDANRDGTVDYQLFNDDQGSRTPAGTNNALNSTYVRNVSAGTVRGPFAFTSFWANNSSLILSVPAAELGVTAANPAFDFYVSAISLGNENGTERAPNSGMYAYNMAAPRFMHNDADGSIALAANTSGDVQVYANARGFLGGDQAGHSYEQGLLILVADNQVGASEAAVVTLSFPYNFRVEQTTMAANANLSGYVVNRLGDLDNQLGSGQLWTGVDNRGRTPLNFHGIAHFSLGSAGAQVEFEEAALDLTGHDASYVDARLDAKWWVHMLSSAVDANLGRATYNMIATASVDATLTPTLTDANLGVGTTNSFTLDAAARKKLSEHVRTSGGVTFRTTAEPQYSQGMHLFAWDGRAGGTAKSPTLRALTVTRLP